MAERTTESSSDPYGLGIFRLAAAWRRHPPGRPGLLTALGVGLLLFLLLFARWDPTSADRVALAALAKHSISENDVAAYASDYAARMSTLWNVGVLIAVLCSWRLVYWGLYLGLLTGAALAWGLYRWPITRPAVVVLDWVLFAAVLGPARAMRLIARGCLAVFLLSWRVAGASASLLRAVLIAAGQGLVVCLGVVAIAAGAGFHGIVWVVSGLVGAAVALGRALWMALRWALQPVGLVIVLVAALVWAGATLLVRSLGVFARMVGPVLGATLRFAWRGLKLVGRGVGTLFIWVVRLVWAAIRAAAVGLAQVLLALGRLLRAAGGLLMIPLGWVGLAIRATVRLIVALGGVIWAGLAVGARAMWAATSLLLIALLAVGRALGRSLKVCALAFVVIAIVFVRVVRTASGYLAAGLFTAVRAAATGLQAVGFILVAPLNLAFRVLLSLARGIAKLWAPLLRAVGAAVSVAGRALRPLARLAAVAVAVLGLVWWGGLIVSQPAETWTAAASGVWSVVTRIAFVVLLIGGGLGAVIAGAFGYSRLRPAIATAIRVAVRWWGSPRVQNVLRFVALSLRGAGSIAASLLIVPLRGMGWMFAAIALLVILPIRLVGRLLGLAFKGLLVVVGLAIRAIGLLVHALASGLVLIGRPLMAVVGAGLGLMVVGFGILFRALRSGFLLAMQILLLGATVVLRGWGTVARVLALGAWSIALGLGRVVRFGAHSLRAAGRAVVGAAGPGPEFVPRPIWLAIATLFLAVQLPVRLVPLAVVGSATGVMALAGVAAAPGRQRQEVAAMSMSNPRVSRESIIGVVGLVWIVGAIFGIFVLWPKEPEPVIVNHWANVYMMDAPVFPALSKQFNEERHRTSSGRRIEVRPTLVNSGLIADELISRVATGQPSGVCNQAAGGCQTPDPPTLITPASEHWFPYINYQAGQTVIDKADTSLLATAYNGIVMQRGMAQCLGWPDREIGFADVVALRHDPRGWASCPTAKTEWGPNVLISYSDPFSSSTGRSVLYSLYGIASGKQPEALTEADARNPEVVAYIREFQGAVDHYVPDTTVLARKMLEGPRFGQIFFFPENNFVTLKRGLVTVQVPGEAKPRALQQDMVMIYPKEGAPANRHSAAIVHASWVTAEGREAAQQWVAFLREDAQQRLLVERGFRPAGNVPFEDVINLANGVDPRKPTKIINPDTVDPAAAKIILDSWGEVKKPGVVTFVVDTSGSMAGAKMDQAKQGMMNVLDKLATRNLVGFLTFSNQVNTRIPVGPITENKYRIADAVQAMRPSGETALYDAIAEAVQMADQAEPDLQAIRGVVVLTDGKANRGQPLDRVITMSVDERPVRGCSGFESEPQCRDQSGQQVAKDKVLGEGLALPTAHDIHIFYVGIGGDADLEVGRLLASATASTYVKTTEQNLAAVVETFGLYF